MKYQLKGVMASTEKDSVNLGYPTLGGGKKYARVIISWRDLEKEMMIKISL
ncbi:MAG: hypothetical protein IIW92_00930 [Lachnospiraceae bacterium]|nr:hypothetical protein [Lachnospiraceae bacterium]